MNLNKNILKSTFLFLLPLFGSFFLVKSFALDLCNPCYAGDSGETRRAGTSYSGVIAGSGTQCQGATGSYCWYISVWGDKWTSCTCGGSTVGTPPSTPSCATNHCRDGCPDWYNCSICPNNCVCKEDCPYAWGCNGSMRTCGAIADYFGYKSVCGTPCDPGCPEANTCACNAAYCCTTSAPSTPTPISPSGNVGRVTNVTLDWSDVSWGQDCNGNSNGNYYGIYTRRNGDSSTDSGTLWYQNIPSQLSYNLARSCNDSYQWWVIAHNGTVQGSWSSAMTFTQSGFTGPSSTISSSTTTVSYPNSISFSATATDPDNNLSWMRLRVYRIDGYGTGSTSMTSIYTSSSYTCSGGSCSTTFSWSPTNAQSGYYYAGLLEASDSCGYTTMSANSHIFQVAPTYNLIVNVRENDLVLPDENGNIDLNAVCSTDQGPLANVTVTYTASDGVTTRSAVSNASGVATFNSVPVAQVPLTLNATPNFIQACESYGFYCLDGASQVGHSIDFTGIPVGGTKTETISLGEEKKDSWETVFNGDIYARNGNISVSCSSATAGGSFETTTIVEDQIGGYFRVAGELNSDSTDDIYTGDNSGYAKDLDGLEGNPGNAQNSADVWFSNYEFPSLDSSTAPTISSVNSISGNRVYKSGNLNVSGTYNLGSPDALSLVYVDGDLNFTGNLTSTNGLIIFVVRGNTTISSSVGIATYTDGISFTPTTAANIKAGILSLGNVFFASSGSGDTPVILDGFVISRENIAFNRDLIENNDRFPAHVFKFNTKIFSMLSDLEEVLNTGLATYDVQWIYDAN